MKRFIKIMFVAIIALFVLVACDNDNPTPNEATVKLVDEISELKLKEKYQITYTVENGTEASVEYSSSDDSIAEVDEFGEVVARKAGEVVITVKVNLLDGSVITKELKITVPENDEFKVTFNLGGGSIAGNNDGYVVLKKGSNYTLPIPTKDKSKFLGWSFTGSTDYVTELTDVKENVTVKANWISLYEISYELNGGTYNLEKSEVEEGSTIQLGIPSKENFTFLGWSFSQSSTSYVTEVANVKGNYTLYAVWEPNRMNITFDLDGGYYTGAKYVTYGGTLNLGTAKKIGCEFLGWSLTKGSSEYVTKLENVTEAKTLYANWKASVYKINYVLDGGTLSSELNEFAAGTAVTLPTATKTGFTFLGWTLSQGSRVYVSEIKNQTADVTVYANFATGLIVGANASYNTLADALAASKDGDTIYVLSGSFAGATIDKAVTIKGANYGLNPNVTERGNETVFTSDLVVASDNVIIDGVSITGLAKFTFATDRNIDNVQFLNCVVSGSTVNPDSQSNNVAPFNLAAGAGFELSNIAIKKARINALTTGRPMIAFVNFVKNLTIENSEFYGGTVKSNYNDGVKTTDGANALYGDVNIIGNYFYNYSQYVLWFRGFGAGNFNIINNKFESCGQTAASHAAATFTKFTGTGTANIEITCNEIVNSYMLLRLDATDLTSDSKVTLSDNVLTNCSGTYVVKNSDTDITIDSKHSYYGVNNVADSLFLNSSHSNDCSKDAVLTFGALYSLSNNIVYNTNGGTNPNNAITSYAPGKVTALPKPTRAGYAFEGWMDEFGTVLTEIPASYNENLSLTATWQLLVDANDFIVVNLPDEGIPYLEDLQLEWLFNPSNTYNQNVTFTSSNEAIFTVSQTGLIHTKKIGVATLSIKVAANSSLNQEIEIMVYAPGRFEISYETNSYVTVGDTIQLNATYILQDQSEAILAWKSLDEAIATVDNKGVVKGVSEGNVNIRAYVFNDQEIYFDFLVTVVGQNVSDVLQLVLNSHESNVFTRYNLGIGAGTPSYYMDIFGSVSDLLYNEELVINRQYEAAQAAISSNHGGKKSSTEFICVHYTGNMAKGATAAANANYFATGGNGTSIHYVTGNDGVFHCLDDSLIGFHAGDKTDTPFYWYPTGVMYEEGDPQYPVWGISSNSKFKINGKETTIDVPTGTTEATKKVTGDTFVANGKEQPCINNMGLAFKIVDGQYYMGTTWWCYSQISSGRICSKGGNLNSIGIESAVNLGSDLWYTWHKTAQLVAKLMQDNNLDITRVVGHHFYSAKDCPQPMLENDLEIWWKFKELVIAEYEKLTKFSDYKFEFSIVSGNEGNSERATQDAKAKLIAYKVVITKGGQKEEIILASAINGIYSR
ncbi:MAG: InlB B-repeat-containing protein [Bacilli bacterium]|nr:InlB B-repeat-containing protein [Bacilli bacterium]